MVTRSIMWATTSSAMTRTGILKRSAVLKAFTVRSKHSWGEAGE